MARKNKMATQRIKGAPAADPKELAERYAKKKGDELERRAHLEKLRKQETTRKGKIALERVVIPYLQKVQDQFYEIPSLPEDFLFGVSQLDPEDHKPLGVYFRLAGGSTVVISIRSERVITEKVDETGQCDSAYPKEGKPFIETHADLTEENIGKLINMMIDEMPNKSGESTAVEAPRQPSVEGGGS
jgi:hypothetical protein